MIWSLAFAKSGISNTTFDFVNIEIVALNIEEFNLILKLALMLTARIKPQLEVR